MRSPFLRLRCCSHYVILYFESDPAHLELLGKLPIAERSQFEQLDLPRAYSVLRGRQKVFYHHRNEVDVDIQNIYSIDYEKWLSADLVKQRLIEKATEVKSTFVRISAQSLTQLSNSGLVFVFLFDCHISGLIAPLILEWVVCSVLWLAKYRVSHKVRRTVLV